MPLYEMKCRAGHVYDQHILLCDLDVEQVCTCGAIAVRQISAPLHVFGQQECRYESPRTGQPITSWAERRNDLAKHGDIPYDPGMLEDNTRRLKESETALEKAVDEHVEATWSKMDTQTRGKLYSELTEQGVTADYHRSTKE